MSQNVRKVEAHVSLDINPRTSSGDMPINEGSVYKVRVYADGMLFSIVSPQRVISICAGFPLKLTIIFTIIF